MRLRLWLVAVTVFWVVMTVWLWRTEFGARRPPGSVPAIVVWKKILTAPDTSNLEIRRGTNVIGHGQWRPNVGQELATGQFLPDDEDPLEGLVESLAYYSLDFEGAVTLPDFPTRTRFSFRVKLDTNQNWQTFDAHLSMRPDLYELFANAAAQSVRLRVDAGGDQLDQTFRFADFQQPQKLFTDLGGPMFPMMFGAAGLPLGTNQVSTQTLGQRWDARNDSLLVGGNRVRVYRLQTKFLDHWRVTFFISPVGELLRAEFPGELVLVNNALAGLRQETAP